MALIDSQFDRFFMRTIHALEPYLDQIVIAGGCSNALYRFAPGAGSGPEPLVTFDVDVTVPNAMPAHDTPLADSLTRADLRPVSEQRTASQY